MSVEAATQSSNQFFNLLRGLVRYYPVAHATEVPPILTIDLPVHCCAERPICKSSAAIFIPTPGVFGSVTAARRQ
jgi:hypothetical protein